MSNVVNLPPTIGGFTFKGIHSSEYGVRQTPNSRILSPSKKRTILEIPGRSTSIIEEDGSYNSRVESIKCSYIKRDGETLQRAVRKIAGWLDGVGELTFDYEPEMHYNAFLNSPPPTLKTLEYATFDLEFMINHPFAYETAESFINNVDVSGDSFDIFTDGTVKTPCILIIENIGDSPITNIVISTSHVN